MARVMFKIAFVMAFVVGLLFAASMSIIHAQPYDDQAIRAFLMPPEDCPAPCWQGIQPGAMTASDASSLLETQPWVDNVNVYVDLNVMAWVWTGEQPTWISSLESGVVSFNLRGVQTIRLRTTLRFGDVWLALGQPDRNVVRLTGSTRIAGVEHNASYFDGSLHAIRPRLDCDFSIRDYWNRRVDLYFDYGQTSDFSMDGDPPRRFSPYDRPYC